MESHQALKHSLIKYFHPLLIFNVLFSVQGFQIDALPSYPLETPAQRPPYLKKLFKVHFLQNTEIIKSSHHGIQQNKIHSLVTHFSSIFLIQIERTASTSPTCAVWLQFPPHSTKLFFLTWVLIVLKCFFAFSVPVLE